MGFSIWLVKKPRIFADTKAKAALYDNETHVFARFSTYSVWLEQRRYAKKFLTFKQWVILDWYFHWQLESSNYILMNALYRFREQQLHTCPLYIQALLSIHSDIQ